MTLYLKYRPQTINELDLTLVREKLANLVKSDTIPHAFLFAGPKGTGKTSAARILAKYLNCESPKKGEPCNKCPLCISITKGQSMDVIELDAASNRGIDDIRSLREQVILAPSSAQKKIYIFDEAHMLTTEAANAFLKTLEEPPSHVVFILATTDPQKLPSTILSRLTTVQFQKANPQEINRQLTRVTKGEDLKLDKETISLIAEHADGSFRDATKILEDLVLSGKKITSSFAASHLGQSQSADVDKFMSSLSNKDSEALLKEIDTLIAQSAPFKPFIDSLISNLRLSLRSQSSSLTQFQITKLITMLINARTQLAYSPIESLPLELVVVNWCRSTSKKKAIKKAKPAPVAKPEPQTESKPELDELSWSRMMTSLRENNASVEALLRAAHPLGCDGKRLTIGVYYRFHKEQLEIGENKLALESIAAQVLGNPIKVDYTLTERKNPLPNPTPQKPSAMSTSEAGLTNPADEDIISAAKEIFGT